MSAVLRRCRTVLTAVLSVSSLCLVTTAHAQQDDRALAEGILLNLVTLSSSQLSLARPVAAWQWRHHGAADDTQADQVLLDGFVILAPRFGIDADVAHRFYSDQLDASRQVKAKLLALWQKGETAPDVAADRFESTRAETYRLSQAMLSALARAQGVSQRPDCPVLLEHAITRWTTQLTTLPDAEKAALPVALGHVCRQGGIGGTA